MHAEIEKLRNFVAENKIDRALQLLKSCVTPGTDFDKQVITISSTYTDLRNKENIGLLSDGDVFRLKAKLSYSLLELADNIESSNNLPAETSQRETAAYIQKKKVFISYNHHDVAVANILKDSLTASNIEVFIDSEKMQAGEDIKGFIENCIKETACTISIVSKNSLLSAWVAMESINTFHFEKTGVAKKFIACYLSDDFFKRDFTDTAFDSIENEITEIQKLITVRMQKNRSIRDLQNELSRFTELRNNLDEIIRRLRESLCINIGDGNIENNLIKLISAINS